MWTLFKRSTKPTEAQIEMVKDLKKFREELIQHRVNLKVHPQSAVRLMVEFFNSTSPRQDRDIASKLTELKGDEAFREALRELSVHLRQTGRDSCGMNRTQFGQHVRDENVFLGGVNYAHTRNVAQILVEGDESDYYRTVNAQATEYLQTHLSKMIMAINVVTNSQVVAEILEN